MIRKIALVLGTIGFLAVGGSIALAQTVSATTSSPTTALSPKMVLQIGPAGRVLLRGNVDSVSATSITVKSWGGDWTVNVPTTAEVMPRDVALTDFKQGDFVGVQGTVNQSSGWTIDASLVRDWTARQALNQEISSNVQAAHQEMAARPRIVQGTLSNLDATAQTFTLTTANGMAYSVALASNAKLLARNWATLDFSSVNDGDTVRIYGTVSSSTISALIFRDVSVK